METNTCPYSQANGFESGRCEQHASHLAVRAWYVVCPPTQLTAAKAWDIEPSRYNDGVGNKHTRIVPGHRCFPYDTTISQIKFYPKILTHTHIQALILPPPRTDFVKTSCAPIRSTRSGDHRLTASKPVDADSTLHILQRKCGTSCVYAHSLRRRKSGDIGSSRCTHSAGKKHPPILPGHRCSPNDTTTPGEHYPEIPSHTHAQVRCFFPSLGSALGTCRRPDTKYTKRCSQADGIKLSRCDSTRHTLQHERGTS